MFATLIVVGEVGGRWRTQIADKHERRDVQITLEEIVSRAWSINDYDGTKFPVTVEWLQEAAEFPPFANVRTPSVFDGRIPSSFLKLTCPIEYSDAYVADYLRANPSSDDEGWMPPKYAIEELIAKSALDDLKGVLVEIVLAANIARFGSLQFNDVYSFVDDVQSSESHEMIGYYSAETLEGSERRGWPSFQNSTVPQVVRWLERVPGYNERHTSTRLGRALAAASYVMTSGVSGTKLNLVWALMGLEALYAKGSTALQQQLVDKTEVFLGPRTKHKREFANMYDFRSRFLHGDIDLTYAHNEYTASEKYGKFRDALYESEMVAVGLLFATLQRMCEQGRFELSFEYVVRDG